MGFLWMGSSGEPANQSEKAPDFEAFHQSMWAGDVNLSDKNTKSVFGMVHWERLVQNMKQARFDEALRIVSER